MYSLDSLRDSAKLEFDFTTELHGVYTEGHKGITRKIPADTLLNTGTYQNLTRYRALAARIESGIYTEGDADSLIRYNPEFFHTYRVLGDYFGAKGEGQRAEGYYRQAMEKEAPSAAERRAVGQ